jgi:hypothetical protein
MSKITIDRAVVEQATKAMLNFPGDISDEMFESIRALKAVLAQQAEPDHETRAEIAEQQVVQLAEERDHYRNLWQKAQQAEPVQEPVAYIHRQGNHWEVSERHLDSDEKARGWTEEPLYTAPPHQKQVGWMQKSTGVIRCDWGFDTTGYVPVYAAQEQSE